MKSRILGSIIFVLLIIVPLACVTRGQNFSSDVSWVSVGKTTQSDVNKRLGVPFSVGNSSGLASWTYGYHKHNLFGESHNKELRLIWNKDGTVNSYSFNSSFQEDKQVKY